MYISISLWLEIQQEDVDLIALPIEKTSYQDRTLTATFDRLTLRIYRY